MLTRTIEAGNSAERIGPFPRITVIGDRETSNLEAIVNHIRRHFGVFELGGVIVPSGEFDDSILDIADRVPCISGGFGIPVITEGDPNFGMRFITQPNSLITADIAFQHVPYEAARLREDPTYRERYCRQLEDEVARTDPALVFLSNFKIVLDADFVARFPGKIVNVHPSMLPLLKGFRPEYRADTGENPQAAGYTFHIVDTDLDSGAVLFHQRVLLEDHDPEEEKELGSEAYVKLREERLRLAIIIAQAQYVGPVLEMVLSKTQRKVVEGEEAFSVERRSGFSRSPSYIAQLHQEYEGWAANQENPLSFEEWDKVRKPYRRMLFKVGGRWRTLESILGAKPVSDTLPSNSTPVDPNRPVRVTAKRMPIWWQVGGLTETDDPRETT